MMIADCRFPALPERYDAALREAVAFVLERFRPVGIVATGTIIRGNPDPASDLDLWVIHVEPLRQRIQKLFKGVPAEIFVNPPWVVDDYFAHDQASGRAITAHMLATGFVVLAADPVVEELRNKAKKKLTEPHTATDEAVLQARYFAASLFEDAVDVGSRDPATASLLMAQAVTEAIRYTFLARRRYIPRNKDLLDELGRLDPEGGADAKAFFEAANDAERIALAGALADRLLQARGFFEWASAAEAKPRPEQE